MKTLFLITFSILFIANTFAQDRDSILLQKNHEFGFHAGFTTGAGFSYRYWPNNYGLQITILPVKTEDQTFISLGLTGLYSFYNSKRLRFFGYLGNNYTVNNYSTTVYDNWDPINGSTTHKVFSRNKTYNIGFGPGFGFGSTVRFNLMLGYGFYDVFGKFNVYPTGEVGLYFRF